MEHSTENSDILNTLSTQMANAVEHVGPALVTVNGRRRQAASGVMWKAGLVLTADHVLEREEDLTVGTHDGQTLAAELAGRDPSSDLALLRVAGLGAEAPTWAEGAARVGQLLLAVGRPSEEGPMASLGIVSAVGGPLRTGRGGMLERYIRTDAIPYPGFSGGPLVDVQGAILGIMTTGLVNGVALGIPAEAASRVAETLEEHGQIRRGYLGISSQPVRLPEGQRGGLPQESGLLIVRVEEDSPAARAGLLLGDILVALDGEAVSDTGELQVRLTGSRVGTTVPVEVIRGGTPQTVQVTVGQRG
ncbi:MAG: trypsin-like peptidase domain-containing protein [Geodermatophilaceae bacterium]|nr:trypsin-like peptidase domain-containing protein [Geodermatophilaceae bacterium]